MKTLTKLEQFVWKNQDRSCAALASELNRSEAAVMTAFGRASAKVQECEARITAIQSLKDLLAAYHGLTLGRQDTEFEGKIKINARTALRVLGAPSLELLFR